MKFQINNDSIYIDKLNKEKELKRNKMHSFHRYYGKLIPAIPSLFIKEFTKEGDLIFDPFTGSGTTAVEALSNRRNFVGFEINPLSVEISKVKTKNLKIEKLLHYNDELIKMIREDKSTVKDQDFPYIMNKDHWFKKEVQRDLIVIKNNINRMFNEDDKDPNYKIFYEMTLSGIIKNVSNADTQHVFPGVSKRMRALEAEGKINIDTIASFERGIKRRATYYDIYQEDFTAQIYLGDSSYIEIEGLENTVDLIITNPPYISSVRYIETLKLEMYWMEYVKSSDEYFELAKTMLGNDRLHKKDYATYDLTRYTEINEVIEEMAKIDYKSAKIIGDFFNNIEKTIINMSRVLKKGGKAVIKISDSKMKKKVIETGRFMTLIAERNGFKLVDLFLDEINNNSRSLTTSRNSYSDIITHDYIIIWEKCDE